MHVVSSTACFFKIKTVGNCLLLYQYIYHLIQLEDNKLIYFQVLHCDWNHHMSNLATIEAWISKDQFT